MKKKHIIIQLEQKQETSICLNSPHSLKSTFSKLKIKRNIFNAVKVVHKNSTTITILNGEVLKTLSFRDKQYKNVWEHIPIHSAQHYTSSFSQ